MAEEFQAEICGGNWWINPSRSVFSAAAAAPCSMGLGHDVAGYGWPVSHMMIDHHEHHMMNNMDHDNNNNKARSNSSGETNNSVCESPNIAFQEVLQKPHQHAQTGLLIDSTLQIMGFGLSPSDLNQPNLVSGGRSENNSTTNTIYSMLQDQDHHQISTSTGFSAGSASFGYDSAALLQSLFDGDSQPQVQQQPHFCNNRSLNYSSSSPNYGSNNGNSNTVAPSSWTRNSIPAPKQLSAGAGGLHFSNNAQFWNAGSEAVLRERNLRPSPNFRPVPQQYAVPAFEQKAKCNNNSLTSATKPNNMISNEDVHQELGSSVAKKGGSGGGDGDQPVLKRARIETPSPLPTFKVRKEKLGDRITALQQLVSPFGKTDTASVLHEAIEYIKFLHDQVSVLSTPYMKNGTSVQVPQQGLNKLKDQENPKIQDLKSRGLCLVPISSTFPVANETTTDFWTPTFGGTFR